MPFVKPTSIKLTSDERERIVKDVINKIDTHLIARHDWEDYRNEGRSMYYQEDFPRSMNIKNPSKLRSALTQENVDTIHAQMMATVFAERDIMKAKATMGMSEAEAGDIQEYMNYKMREDINPEEEGGIYGVIDRWHKGGILDGTYPIKYVIEELKAPETEEVVTSPLETGEPLVGETGEPITQTRVSSRMRVRIEVLEMDDVVIPVDGDMNVTLVNTPGWVGHLFSQTYSYFKENYPKENIDKISLIQYVKDNAEREKLLTSTKEETDVQETDREFLGLEIPETALKPIQGIEWYGTQLINGKLQEVIVTVERQSKTLLDIIPNTIRIRPFSLARFWYVPGKTYAAGLPMLSKGYQDAYDTYFNLDVDSIKMSMFGYGFYEPDIGQDPSKITPGFNEWYPVKRVGGIQHIKVDYRDPLLIAKQQQILSLNERQFGISALKLGAQPQKKRTLGENVIQTQEGNVRLDLIIKRFQNYSMNDMFDKLFHLFGLLMDEKEQYQVVGPKGKPIIKEMSPEKLKKKPNFELVATSITASKRLEQQEAMQAIGIVAKSPMLQVIMRDESKFYSFGKWALDKIGLRPEDYRDWWTEPPGGLKVTHSPEDENDRFYRGETGIPEMKEDHKRHIEKHKTFLAEHPEMEEEYKLNLGKHILLHERMDAKKQQMMQFMQMMKEQMQPGGGGGFGGETTEVAGAAPGGAGFGGVPTSPY